MNLYRSLTIPFALLIVGATALACGDDDDAISTPVGDGGSPDATLPDGGVSPDAPKITTAPALPSIVGGSAAAPVQLAATGATPITWAITAGAAPAGMTLSAAGAYAGTPTAAGSFTFTVTATNAAGTDSVQFTQTIGLASVDAYALLADNKLAPISAPTGGVAVGGTPTALTGLEAGETLVSIDRRPQNGYLYGLARNAAGAVRVYAITPGANLATKVGDAVTYSDGASDGEVGIDFNPTVDRIRVVTSTNKNFRLNPNNGAAAVADTRDGALTDNGAAATGVGETAYTNNAIDLAVTAAVTQYTIAGSKLFIQNPPNNGVLTAGVTIAPAVTNVFGFDIAPGVDVATSNAAAVGLGFGIVKQAGQTAEQLATIDLTSGALVSLGTLPFTGTKGFSLEKPLATPLVALTSDGIGGYNIVRFQDSAPATIKTSAAITGVTAGEVLVGLDYRPTTGQLYTLGIDVALGTGTLYRVDPQNGGALTVVGTAGGIAVEGGFGALGDRFSIDFNPTVDRIRVVSSGGLNFRVQPDTGVAVDSDMNVAGTNPDSAINGGTTGLDGVAYTNGPPATGATGVTAEYGISSTTDSIYLFSNPNGGVLGAAIPLKVGGVTIDFTAASIDIKQSVTTGAANTAPAAGTAYAALTIGGATNIYRVDLTTGAATLSGALGAGTLTVVGLAAGR